MKAQVKRVTKMRWDQIRRRLGKEAKYTDVPATVPGVLFRGLFVDASKLEIAVAWPVDRPMDAQEEFAKEHCFGGMPVETVERSIDRRGLSIIQDTEETKDETDL